MEKERRAERDALINDYAEYVRSVVAGTLRTLAIEFDCFDECISAGYFGLVEAAERYDARRNVAFKHFAFLRIRGAIIDYLRTVSGLSPKTYRRLKAVEAVSDMRNTGAPMDASVRRRLAKVMDITAAAAVVHQLATDPLANGASSLENQVTPQDEIESKQERRLLLSLVSHLPQRERDVLHQHYFMDKPFKQIAEEQGVTKSWVSRIHTAGIQRLKERYLRENTATFACAA